MHIITSYKCITVHHTLHSFYFCEPNLFIETIASYEMMIRLFFDECAEIKKCGCMFQPRQLSHEMYVTMNRLN